MEKITLDHIGGYEYQKKEANKIVDFFKNYDTYVKAGATLPKGVIFFGSPGNGKTMFANAIANESGAKIFQFTNEDFEELNTEEISKKLALTFKKAKAAGPSIIIIDEIDQLVGNDGGFGGEPSDREKDNLRTLLCEIDKLDGFPVCIIATGNLDIHDLPSALVREGRLEKHIEIGAPDSGDRHHILSKYLCNSPVFRELEIDELVVLTQGLTCASLRSLVNDVLIYTITNNLSSVKISDFLEPLQAIISHGIKKKSAANIDHVVYHEIGHLLIDYIINKNYGFLSVETYGESAGRYRRFGMFFTKEIEDPTELTSYEEGINLMRVALGGLAATEVYTGEKRMGSYSDIAKTKTIYESMARNGLLGFKNIGYFLSQRETVTPKEVDNEYTQLLNKIYQENIEILEANKQIAEALYVKLKDKRILSVDETKQILESFLVVNPFQK